MDPPIVRFRDHSRLFILCSSTISYLKIHQQFDGFRENQRWLEMVKAVQQPAMLSLDSVAES